MHTSLYMELENDNVIQLTGKDFYILSQSTKVKYENKDYCITFIIIMLL